MKTILFCIYFLVTYQPAKAQGKPGSVPLTGIWKGTSICQVKNSPCHDEIVVYHISKAEGADSFSIRADKIVNGVEQDMGVLECKFNRKTNQLVSNSHKANWTFNVKDKSIDGTLFVQETLYRIIKLNKQD